MQRGSLLRALLPLCCVLVSCSSEGPQAGSTASQSAACVPPEPQNPTCESIGLAGLMEFKVEAPLGSSYPISPGHTLTLNSPDGILLKWVSTLGIDAVIVKGGDGANIYRYDPEAKNSGEDWLVSPNNASGGPAAISHVTFCYDYELEVSKTVTTSFDRTWDWTITKKADVRALTLAMGQTSMANYEVMVSAGMPVDSNWAMMGQISIHNPAPSLVSVAAMDAQITAVKDVAGDIEATVTCPATFPYLLPPLADLLCAYEAKLPDAMARTNIATATSVGIIGSGSGQAAVDFSLTQPRELNKCVTVSDSMVGALGVVCVDASPKTFIYRFPIGPYNECGTYKVSNTALIEELGKSASWTIDVTVPCDLGCTLTPGYWKTHSEFGPAPYDDAWAMLPSGASTPFYLSGMTYYQVLNTPPKGNAYYILAHAFIAAQLNKLNGASSAAIQDSFAEAMGLLNSHAPADITKCNAALRARFIELGGMLDAYNNGMTGPGHCTE